MGNKYALAIFLALVAATWVNADDIFDNGPPDGSGAVSNVVREVFGASRAVLDDFVIPDGQTWKITDFHWIHIWNTLPPGSGTGANLEFWSDNNGAPGGPLAIAEVSNYIEESTGTEFFSRPGAKSSVRFDPIILGPGTYWFRAQIIGPENNFWLIRPHENGSEFWIDYEDLNGLEPGSDVFGVAADLNFVVTGEIIPGGYVPPAAFSVFRGIIVKAAILDFADSDNVRAVFNPGFTLTAYEAPVWLIFDASASSAMDFLVESSASSPGLTYTVEAWNWNTSHYDVIGIHSESFPADSIWIFPVVAADHVDAEGRVRSRVGWRKTSFTIIYPWEVRVDQVGWHYE